MSRYLLELQEADGHVMAEVLYFSAHGAGLVDDDGLPLISYGRTIALCGREWRVQTAEPAATYIRITCRAVPTDSEVGPIPSDRVYQRSLRGSQPEGVEHADGAARVPDAPGRDGSRR